MSTSLRTVISGITFALMVLASAVVPALSAQASTPQGELVPSFGTAGVASAVANSTGNQVVHQRDGKIVVGVLANSNAISLLRFTADGRLDTSYNSAGSVPGAANLNVPGYGAAQFGGIAIQSDDRVLLFGDMEDPANGGLPDLVVARFTTNGTLDTSFNSGLGYRIIGRHDEGELSGAIAIDRAGKITLAGSRSRLSAALDDTSFLTRLTPSGALDTSFGTAGTSLIDFVPGLNESPLSLIVQADGKYALTGTSVTSRVLVARLTSTGFVDTTFAASGSTPGWRLVEIQSSINVGLQIIQASSGEYMIAGKASAGSGYNAFLLKLLANGLTDTTFAASSDHPGWVLLRIGSTATKAFSVVQDFQGRFILAGDYVAGFPVSGAFAARFTPSGETDSSFASSGSTPGIFTFHPVPEDSNSISAMMILPNGDLVGAGYVYANSTTMSTQLIKLQGERRPDPLPDTGLSLFSGFTLALVLSFAGISLAVISRRGRKSL